PRPPPESRGVRRLAAGRNIWSGPGLRSSFPCLSHPLKTSLGLQTLGRAKPTLHGGPITGWKPVPRSPLLDGKQFFNLNHLLWSDKGRETAERVRPGIWRL